MNRSVNKSDEEGTMGEVEDKTTATTTSTYTCTREKEPLEVKSR